MQAKRIKNQSRIGAVLLSLVLSLFSASAALAVGAPAPNSPLIGVVNVNRASAVELQRLPGVGPARARAIIEARKSRGEFRSLDELTGIEGIGPASLRALRPHLVLKGETTARRRVAPQSPRP